MSTVSEIRNSACAWAVNLAEDNSHGYDQRSRWGPDYDCSSSTIRAYQQAGVPLTCTYTGNMRQDMLVHGFADVTKKIDLKTGKGLKKGDVLLHEVHHTALYVGDGKIVNAGGNEYGKATGGRTGDQTGKEIAIINYYNFPWQYVLRYEEGADAAPTPEPAAGLAGTYTVKGGDTLSQIALAHSTTIQELARLNNIADVNKIYAGQVLILPGHTEPVSSEDPPADDEDARTAALARAVIRGEYGNGVTRVLKLGKDYKKVQAAVNRLLAGN